MISKRFKKSALKRACGLKVNSITKKEDDMSNGHRYRKTFGQGKLPELRVLRSRRGNFYPILLALLRNREEEARKPEFNLCGAGLTTEQVGEIFGDIYGKQ
ncbi:transposase [Thermonema rossianum]|uniref:transposase n=1 Tax=Thermonema rossianum TaxID=55505 RepID=UPI00068C071C|nr:transposase [Thermonema rossianum]